PDGLALALAGDTGALRLWSMPDGRERASDASSKETLLSVAWSPDGRFVAAGDTSGTVRIWEASRLAEKTSLSGAYARSSLPCLFEGRENARIGGAGSDSQAL